MSLLPVTAWHWLIAAAALAGLEIVAPGAFMIWLAGAAAATALVVLLLDPAWEAQAVIFVVLSVASVLLGRRWLGLRPRAELHPELNRRADRLVGALVTVLEPVGEGHGRVVVGDAPWPATGATLAAGARARVVRVEGTTLVVEPA